MHGDDGDPATPDGDRADSTVVRSLAVDVDDVVTAAEARREGRPAVLRATPPYHPRMRARLHVEGSDDPEALHLDPGELLDDTAPSRPTPDETEERLRASDREYTPAIHREYHVEAVAAWRETVREYVVDAVTVETPDGPRDVEIKPLG